MATTAKPSGWQSVQPALGIEPNESWPVDPYLLWAEATRYAGYPSKELGDDTLLPLLVELPVQLPPAPVGRHEPDITTLAALINAPKAAGQPASRYLTLVVPRRLLGAVVTLQQRGYIARFQLGAARGSPPRVEPTVRMLGGNPNAAPIDTLGIVDDGCCLAHSAFRSPENTSRFRFVWDQSPLAKFPAPWIRLQVQDGSGPTQYGGELTQTDIEEYLSRHPRLGEAGERELYAALDRSDWGRLDRIHGACVLHLLAGPDKYLPELATPGGAVTQPIIFVQLPEQTVADTSGGSVGFYVLDAVRYIIRRTQDLNGGGDRWRTTINVSLGSLGGPHNGSTMVERALDEIVQSYPDGRVRIVMAAGNAAGRRIHGVRRIAPKGSAPFHVMVPPDNEFESFVELWPQLPPGPTSVNDLRIEVRTPDGTALNGAKVGEVHALKDPNGRIVAGLVFPRAAAQAEHQPMVLLAIRPTRGSSDHPAAPSGAWTITVSSKLSKPVVVHGWVERNDTVIRRRSAQRTVFIDDVARGEPGGWLSDDSTLSSLANGSEVDCVGGFEVNRQCVTSYSSRGPVLGNAENRPDLYGASDLSASLPGLAVPGFFSGTRARLSGTSAAAPRVARWIAEGADPGRLVTLDNAQPPTINPSQNPMGVLYVSEVDGA